MADTMFIAKPLPKSISKGNTHSGQELNEENMVSMKIWGTLENIAKIVKKGSKRTVTKEIIEETIIELCNNRFVPLSNLAVLLDREPNALRRTYLNPMVTNGQLKLAYPTKRNHPQQAYTKNTNEH